MRIDWKQLKRMAVRTVSGTAIGHVSGVVLETEGQLVAQYVVSSSFAFGDTLVGRDQVVRFEKGAMIVEDSIGKEKKKMVKKMPGLSDPALKPVATRDT